MVATPATPVAKASDTVAYICPIILIYALCSFYLEKLHDRLLVLLCYARPASNSPNIPKCLAPTCIT